MISSFRTFLCFTIDSIIIFCIILYMSVILAILCPLLFNSCCKLQTLRSFQEHMRSIFWFLKIAAFIADIHIAHFLVLNENLINTSQLGIYNFTQKSLMLLYFWANKSIIVLILSFQNFMMFIFEYATDISWNFLFLQF
jgi:hypothetical protein